MPNINRRRPSPNQPANDVTIAVNIPIITIRNLHNIRHNNRRQFRATLVENTLVNLANSSRVIITSHRLRIMDLRQSTVNHHRRPQIKVDRVHIKSPYPIPYTSTHNPPKPSLRNTNLLHNLNLNRLLHIFLSHFQNIYSNVQAKHQHNIFNLHVNRPNLHRHRQVHPN